jgi:hypothetical protein
MKIEGDRIYFPEGDYVECSYPIHSHVTFGDILIVLLDLPIKVPNNRNVMAYDMKGNMLWQIENLFPNDKWCHYNLIRTDENDLIHLYNWCGFVVKLDPFTGKVLQRIFTK